MSAGWRRLRAAAGHSARGVIRAYRDEAAFRQEVWLLAVLLPLAFWLEPDNGKRALLVLSALLAPIAELLNTAVEAAVDLSSPRQHPLAQKAKDAGSAAVFVALLTMAAVWLCVLVG